MREWSMAYNFLRDDRDQPFLLPPDLRDWLPADHLAWFVLDVVDQVDLGPFYRAHRDDGHGHPAYDPKLLLGVLLYGYCLGVRSSRQIERRSRSYYLASRLKGGNAEARSSRPQNTSERDAEGRGRRRMRYPRRWQRGRV
jgi:transposase